MSRQKTYSAQNGYVYQYQFAGQASVPKGIRYSFRVWSQNAVANDVNLLLETAVAAPWEAAHRFELTETQKYAVAKMAFFSCLDDATGPKPPETLIVITLEDLTSIAAALDLV